MDKKQAPGSFEIVIQHELQFRQVTDVGHRTAGLGKKGQKWQYERKTNRWALLQFLKTQTKFLENK